MPWPITKALAKTTCTPIVCASQGAWLVSCGSGVGQWPNQNHFSYKDNAHAFCIKYSWCHTGKNDARVARTSDAIRLTTEILSYTLQVVNKVLKMLNLRLISISQLQEFENTAMTDLKYAAIQHGFFYLDLRS